MTKLAEGKGRGELGDADVDLRVDPVVVGVVELDDVEGDRVEEREHDGRAVGEEVADDWLRVGEVQERHLQRLGVLLAEVLDALTVDGRRGLIDVGHEEVAELADDRPPDRVRLDPVLDRVGLDVAELLERQLLGESARSER